MQQNEGRRVKEKRKLTIAIVKKYTLWHGKKQQKQRMELLLFLTCSYCYNTREYYYYIKK